MLKKVRVKIVTERFPLSGSLFEGKGVSEASKGEGSERMEVMTQAAYLDDGARVSISYEESEATGLEGSRACISFHKHEPGLISMTRTGSVKTALVFEQGRRHHCVYQTPIMPFEVCVHTSKVQNALESEGVLKLDYAVELRGAQAERSKMTLTLLPAPDAPRGK